MNPNPESAPPLNLCAVAVDPRPMWKRVLSRLWPTHHQPLPELPAWAKDAIVMETVISLSFADRLRVLVSGRVRHRAYTFAENVPGRVESETMAHPLPPVSLGDGPVVEESGRPGLLNHASLIVAGAALYFAGFKVVASFAFAVAVFLYFLEQLPGVFESRDADDDVIDDKHLDEPVAPAIPVTKIPVTEIRDGDILVAAITDICDSADAFNSVRQIIRERLLPTKVDVLVVRGERAGIVNILRPALRVVLKGTAPDPELLAHLQKVSAEQVEAVTESSRRCSHNAAGPG